MMVASLFLKYILMPLIALVLASLMGIIKKKNEALSNRTLIVFILLFGLLMALPGFFGFVGNTFSPWYYLVAQGIYLGLGVVFVRLHRAFFSDVVTWKLFFQIVMIVLIMTLGGYLFAILFNYLAKRAEATQLYLYVYVSAPGHLLLYVSGISGHTLRNL